MPEVAIVSGGTGSIGMATCERLAERGFTVLVADVIAPTSLPAQASFIELDVRSSESVHRTIARARELGDLKALVNCHGIVRETDPLDIPDEVMQQVVDINMNGTARLCGAASPVIVDGGAMVNLSSVTSSMGRTRSGFAYQASKAGIESLTRSYAVALAARHVRVNCVAPGFLSEPMRGQGTEMRARQGGNETVRRFTPSGRLVTPEEVAEAIVFLCSPAASGISGVVLHVDGGQRAY